LGSTASYPYATGICLNKKWCQGVYKVNGNKYGLLLLIGITTYELNWAKTNGGKKLIEKLKEKEVYPFTDLNRESVFTK